MKRLFHRNHEIHDRAEGCEERVSWKLVRYMWTFNKRVEDKIKNLRQKYPNVEFIEVKNGKDLLDVSRLF